jgi:hypothetical protein
VGSVCLPNDSASHLLFEHVRHECVDDLTVLYCIVLLEHLESVEACVAHLINSPSFSCPQL